MNKVKIYLDDIRTPNDKDWLVVRSFYEFVDLINKVGLNNIELISLDHDLGDTAMNEYYNNVSPNYKLDYENIEEKTGYDAAKWLVNLFYSLNELFGVPLTLNLFHHHCLFGDLFKFLMKLLLTTSANP